MAIFNSDTPNRNLMRVFVKEPLDLFIFVNKSPPLASSIKTGPFHAQRENKAQALDPVKTTH